jgi:sulfite reductase (NADPH) hemoprotein beta-component
MAEFRSTIEHVLQQFSSRLVLADSIGLDLDVSFSNRLLSFENPTSIDKSLGTFMSYFQNKQRFIDRIERLLASKPTLGRQLKDSLSKWLDCRDDVDASEKCLEFVDQWLYREGAFDADIAWILQNQSYFKRTSNWILVGDCIDAKKTPGDLSSIHQVFASGEDINLLVFVGVGGSNELIQKDLGLYALTYGNVYVASVNVDVDEPQCMAAIKEADAFVGPSIILMHSKESVSSPLYRYHPLRDTFSIDSSKLSDSLRQFLERESHLSLLSSATPTLPAALTKSIDSDITAAQTSLRESLSKSYESLMRGISLPTLRVLFGSDGGNAESVAKRIAGEAKKRGFGEVQCSAMDTTSPSELSLLLAPALCIFVVSTAGQGEFPTNARNFHKSLMTGSTDETSKLSNMFYAVFGLGDSNYWPKKEQRIFFNKASADLDALLSSSHWSAKKLVERGIGDDQETGGYLSGLRAWLPSLWEALGVARASEGGATDSMSAPQQRAPEVVKATSRHLRGTIAQGLLDASTGALAYEDTLLTKFHGIYQQDDRDLRASRKAEGLEPAYSFMVRVRIPGGVCTLEQYLNLNSIADSHANGSLRATTRQAIQFHGIIKHKLKPSIAQINKMLMDTLAACGDVNRNVMCSITASSYEAYKQVLRFSEKLSSHLTPQTTAYHEIWLDEKIIKGGSVDVEPIYGPTYLPRKFKIAVAIPPSNDVDVFANDLGFIADIEGDLLKGFYVTIGGGMGMTHNNKKTYPRVASFLCYGSPEECIKIAEGVVTTQRDFGDRTNRKHARLKYTLDEFGMDWFRAQVGERVGFPLNVSKDKLPVFKSNGDKYGWNELGSGMVGFTMFIQNGRIKDEEGYKIKSGLERICRVLMGKQLEAGREKPEIRFTPNQHVMIANVDREWVSEVDKELRSFGITYSGKEGKGISGLRLNSMACVALPTCGLAFAESERYLPTLIDRLEDCLDEAGIRSIPITIRMTGCANGCARPYIAEIGLVGKAPGVYNLYLGAAHDGTRVSKMFKEGLEEAEIVKVLREMFKQYAMAIGGPFENEKAAAESVHKWIPFGDWVIKEGIVKETKEGRFFHD